MLDENKVIDMYINQKMSTYVIAQEMNTYPNKIRRILKKFNIELNDKSMAQKQAIETGRSRHPTKGLKRDKKVKEKISESIHQNWKKLSPENRKNRVDKAREQWYNMTEQERESLRTSAAIAVRQASKDGSKMENFLKEELTQNGYDVVFHKTGLIPSENLEVDIFLPVINTAIEIDGPAHFLPVWGEENLQKHIKADAHKSGLLLNCGFVIIRIKHLSKSISEKSKRDTLKQLLPLLNNIKEKFPEQGKRYIELEVK